jgi:hypothetical protein
MLPGNAGEVHPVVGGTMRSSLAVAVGLFFVAATASCVAYTPDSLLHRQRKWATARTVGCLDVATEIVRDPDVPESSPIVDVTFGNRCTHGVHVDLSRLHVLARYADGVRLQLAAYDPRHEIEPRLLAPAGVGRELIEFDPHWAKPAAPTRLCIGVQGLDADRPAETVLPMCFVMQGDGMVPVPETEL